jgi:transcriptional regulator with XRE-family HTH domain
MHQRFTHYLRRERRRIGLSQADVAALLGGPWKGRVSWYERGALPPTPKALEYEAILGRPVSDLLGGAFQLAVYKVRQRARELLRRDVNPHTSRQVKRHHTLERIAA